MLGVNWPLTQILSLAVTFENKVHHKYFTNNSKKTSKTSNYSIIETSYMPHYKLLLTKFRLSVDSTTFR